MAFFRKIEGQHRSEECVGDLEKDAGAVTCVLLSASSASVVHVAKRAETVSHDLMAALTLHVNDKVDAACVVFETGVVETLCAGEPRWAK